MQNLLTQMPAHPFPPPRSPRQKPAEIVIILPGWQGRHIALEIDNPLRMKPQIDEGFSGLRTLGKLVRYRSFDERYTCQQDCSDQERLEPEPEPELQPQLKPQSKPKSYRLASHSTPKHILKRSRLMNQIRQDYNSDNLRAKEWLEGLEDLYDDASRGRELGASRALIQDYATAGMLVSRQFCNAGLLSESYEIFYNTISDFQVYGNLPAVPKDVLQHFVYLSRQYVGLLGFACEEANAKGQKQVAADLKEKSDRARANLFQHFDIHVDRKGALRPIWEVLSDEEDDESDGDLSGDGLSEEGIDRESDNSLLKAPEIRLDDHWQAPEPALMLPALEALREDFGYQSDEDDEARSRSVRARTRKRRKRVKRSGYEADTDTKGRNLPFSPSNPLRRAVNGYDDMGYLADSEDEGEGDDSLHRDVRLERNTEDIAGAEDTEERKEDGEVSANSKNQPNKKGTLKRGPESGYFSDFGQKDNNSE